MTPLALMPDAMDPKRNSVSSSSLSSVGRSDGTPLTHFVACDGERNVPTDPTITPALLTAPAKPRSKLGTSGRSTRPLDVQYAGVVEPFSTDPTAPAVETPLACADAPAGAS